MVNKKSNIISFPLVEIKLKSLRIIKMNTLNYG